MAPVDDSAQNAIDGRENFINGQATTGKDQICTVNLSPQADGTAKGTLTAATDTLLCTYDDVGATPTKCEETLILSDFFDQSGTEGTERKGPIEV